MKRVLRSALLLCALMLSFCLFAQGADCHTMTEDWFGGCEAQVRAASPVEAVLDAYFDAREADFFPGTLPVRQASPRAAQIQEMARRMDAELLDAEVTKVLLDLTETDGGYTAQVYEWTFFDYDDLADGPGGSDTAGFGTWHTMTLTWQGDELRVTGDDYDENDLFQEPLPAASAQAPVTAAYYPTYDAVKAALYGETWVTREFLDGGADTSYYNPAYLNFAGRGGDCTNFTSQCIHAGGIPTDSTWRPYTDTWANAHYSNAYFARNYGREVWDAQESDIYVGSVLYLDRNGTHEYHHSLFCVGSNSAGTPVVNCHTADRYHFPWDYSGETVSVVQLTEYNLADLELTERLLTATAEVALPLYSFYGDSAPTETRTIAAGTTISAKGTFTYQGVGYYLAELEGTLWYIPGQRDLVPTARPEDFALTASAERATDNDYLTVTVTLPALLEGQVSLTLTDGSGARHTAALTGENGAYTAQVDLAACAPGTCILTAVLDQGGSRVTSAPIQITVTHLATVSGTCGPSAAWTLDKDTGKLTLTGSGAVSAGGWTRFRGKIKILWLGQDLNTPPAERFAGCPVEVLWGYDDGAAALAEELGAAFVRLGPFQDVLPGDWYFDIVNEAAELGLFHGLEEHRFGPQVQTSRAMFLTVLGRMAGVDPEQYPETSFTDVAQEAYYRGYVAWGAEQGIVQGVTPETFAPETTITREQAAAMVSRYLTAMGQSLPQKEAKAFTDEEQISGYAREAVALMQRTGLLEGDPDGRFRPQDSMTRAEAAALLLRLQKAAANG